MMRLASVIGKKLFCFFCVGGLEDEDPDANRKLPKAISPSDPCSAWTATVSTGPADYSDSALSNEAGLLGDCSSESSPDRDGGTNERPTRKTAYHDNRCRRSR